MIIPITLERLPKINEDNQLIFELEANSKLKAFMKTGQNPTLTELLYNQSEDDMLSLNEFLDQGNE